MYRSFLEEHEAFSQPEEVFGLMFLSHESGFVFQTENTEGLGLLTFENGYLCFTGYPAEEAPPETLPEETVPETTAETLPEETVAETAVTEETLPEAPAETAAEEHAEEAPTEVHSDEDQEASSASAVPEEEDPAGDGAAEEPREEAAREETAPPETVSPETVPEETVAEATVPEETVPQETEPVLINGKPLETYQVNRTEFYDPITGETTTAKYVYLPMPELTVEVYVDQDVLGNTEAYNVLRLVRQYRSYLLPLIGVCLVLFLLSAVYLCTVAGHSSKSEEVRAGGINRLPLDLYLIGGIFLATGAAALAMAGVPVLLESDFLLGCSLAVSAAFVCCLIFIGFCLAFAAQVKTRDGFWWRNLLCIRFIFLCMRFMRWLEIWLREKAFPWLGQLLKRSGHGSGRVFSGSMRPQKPSPPVPAEF